jgi:hypothetical protein
MGTGMTKSPQDNPTFRTAGPAVLQLDNIMIRNR